MAAELHYLFFDQLKYIFSQVLFSLGFIYTYSEKTIVTIKNIFCQICAFLELKKIQFFSSKNAKNLSIKKKYFFIVTIVISIFFFSFHINSASRVWKEEEECCI